MQQKKELIVIMLSAFIIRMLFIFIFAPYYYENTSPFTNGDSFSYIYPAANLIQKGVYTHEIGYEPAYYGRMPGYPIFLLPFIYFFDEKIHVPVAIAQAILDSLSAIIIFLLIKKHSDNQKIALFFSSLQVVNPFTIVWTTIIGTEIISCFVVLLVGYLLSSVNSFTFRHMLLIGMLIAVGIMIRPNLGIMLPIVIFSIFTSNSKEAIKKHILQTIFVIIGVVIVCLPWVIRNYVNFHKWILLPPLSAGYRNHNDDHIAFLRWVYCWESDAVKVRNQIINGEKFENIFPENIFPNNDDRILLTKLVDKLRTCSSSFYYWQHFKPIENNKACDEEIVEGFYILRNNFRKAFPIRYFLEVPLKNVDKALFKSTLSSKPSASWKMWIIKSLFFYRTTLVILGLLAAVSILFMLPSKKVPSIFMSLFILANYFFFCFYYRQMEMRYLLPSDAMMIPLLGILFTQILYKNR